MAGGTADYYGTTSDARMKSEHTPDVLAIYSRIERVTISTCIIKGIILYVLEIKESEV